MPTSDNIPTRPERAGPPGRKNGDPHEPANSQGPEIKARQQQSEYTIPPYGMPSAVAQPQVPDDFSDYEVIRQHHDLRASITLVRVGAITSPDKRVYAVYRITGPHGEPSLGSFGCTCGEGGSRTPCAHMRYADTEDHARKPHGRRVVA